MAVFMLLQDYIAYPAIFTQDKNGIYDVIIKYKNGEWHTCGKNYDEAYKMAQDLITDMAFFQYSDVLEMPQSANINKNETPIYIGFDNALKIMLRNAMVQSKTKQVVLAKRLKISPPALAQYMKFGKASKLEILAKAFEELGCPLQISCIAR